MVVTAPSPPKPRAPRDNRSIGQPALTHSCADDVRRATSDGICHGGLAFSALALDVAVREALGLALFRSYAYHTGARTDGPSALQVLHPVDEGRAVQADQGVAPRPRVQLWPAVVDRACASVPTERASRMPRGNVRSLRVDTALRHGAPPGHSRLLNVHRAANGVYDVKAPNEMLYGIQA